MTERKQDTDIGLDAFFAAARNDTPLPSDDFMARIEAQALDAIPVPEPVRPLAGLFTQMRQAVGGWPGLAGLAVACAAGLWIGINPPASVETLWGVQADLGTLGIDPLSGYDLAMMEG